MNDYWLKKADEQREKDEQEDKEISEEIDLTYAELIRRLSALIDKFIVNYAEEEAISMADALKRADKLDIQEYAKKAKKYVKDKDFSPQANKEMRIYNLTMKINRLRLLILEASAEMARTTSKVEATVRKAIGDRTKEEIENQAGILGKTTETTLKPAVETIVDKPFLGKPWSKRIWDQEEKTRKTVEKTIKEFLTQGKATNKAVQELKKQVSKEVKNAEYAARRLMITERQRAAAEAQIKAYKESGVEWFEFITEPNCCPKCSKLKGEVFKVSEAQCGVNMRPMHPNCRCNTAMSLGPRDQKTDDPFDEWLRLFEDMPGEEVPAFDEFSQWYNSKRNHKLELKEWLKFDQYDRDRLEKPIHIDKSKIEKFLLKPGAKHAQEFFDVGYTPDKNGYKRLKKDILTAYVHTSTEGRRVSHEGKSQFSFVTYLGNPKKRFRIAWQAEDGYIKLTTGHREDKK